ncbi:predicted protein [Plenodomus lingam JN3]|uniref:Predicted protein n=1 Tax=Leptosphaeria maculans (strain JN3 / isolate v23.1.3 / race Av1-4-5-6-7-8) TaxID=985895 RepID=E4ZLY1_LEPMJ|nr:predicted protein [Plenodomus lingam JN3]CBX92811.1 predicted protein [Plenodomus lingam JN3]
MDATGLPECILTSLDGQLFASVDVATNDLSTGSCTTLLIIPIILVIFIASIFDQTHLSLCVGVASITSHCTAA